VRRRWRIGGVSEVYWRCIGGVLKVYRRCIGRIGVQRDHAAPTKISTTRMVVGVGFQWCTSDTVPVA
jgi:hypothetical protein